VGLFYGAVKKQGITISSRNIGQVPICVNEKGIAMSNALGKFSPI
jgi:hypothetical protein